MSTGDTTNTIPSTEPDSAKALREWAGALSEFTKTMKANRAADESGRRWQTLILALTGLVIGSIAAASVTAIVINTGRITTVERSAEQTKAEKDARQAEMKEFAREVVKEFSVTQRQTVTVLQGKTIDDLVSEAMAKQKKENADGM